MQNFEIKSQVADETIWIIFFIFEDETKGLGLFIGCWATSLLFIYFINILDFICFIEK